MAESGSELFAGNQEEDEEHAVTTPLEEGLRALQQRGCTSLTGPPKSTKLEVDRQREDNDWLTYGTRPQGSRGCNQKNTLYNLNFP